MALLLSYSGETEEVVNLAALLRQDGVPRLGISCSAASSLARLSDVHLALGEITDWDLNRSVDALKRGMIVAALRETGSKTRAAERLGIARQSLQKMMKRLKLTDADVAVDG